MRRFRPIAIDIEKLAEIGAATPVELAVKLRKMPEEVEPKLKKLQGRGLITAHERGEGYERAICSLSKEGRRLAR